MKNDNEIIKNLVAAGVVSPAVNALLSKKTAISEIVEAVILGTYKAHLNALDSKLPLLVLEDGCIVEISPNGEKKIIRRLEKSNIQLPPRFKLS